MSKRKQQRDQLIQHYREHAPNAGRHVFTAVAGNSHVGASVRKNIATGRKRLYGYHGD